MTSPTFILLCHQFLYSDVSNPSTLMSPTFSLTSPTPLLWCHQHFFWRHQSLYFDITAPSSMMDVIRYFAVYVLKVYFIIDSYGVLCRWVTCTCLLLSVWLEDLNVFGCDKKIIILNNPRPSPFPLPPYKVAGLSWFEKKAAAGKYAMTYCFYYRYLIYYFIVILWHYFIIFEKKKKLLLIVTK